MKKVFPARGKQSPLLIEPHEKQNNKSFPSQLEKDKLRALNG